MMRETKAADEKASHPILRIVQDARKNETIVGGIPPFAGSNQWPAVKPGRTEVLAEASMAR